MKLGGAIFMIGALAAGCASDGPAVVDREASCEVHQDFAYAPRSQVDLVFVVDRSAAMAPYRDALAAAARRFDAMLDVREGRPSLHVAVLPADGTAFVCEGDRRATFDCIATLGSAGGTPRPLSALDLALADPANAGFRRPGAWLAVVVFAASDDGSSEPPDAYAARLGGPAVSLGVVADASSAPRLAAFASAVWWNTVVPLDAADWSAALAPLVDTRVIVDFALACLPAGMTSCSATFSDGSSAGTFVLPACRASAPRPCWAALPNPHCEGPDPRELRLERAEEDPRGATVDLRCAVPCSP
jgi:hypothetical protein